MCCVRAYCSDTSIHAQTDTSTFVATDIGTYVASDTVTYIAPDASDTSDASDAVTHAIADHQTIQWRRMRQLQHVRSSAWQCPECG